MVPLRGIPRTGSPDERETASFPSSGAWTASSNSPACSWPNRLVQVLRRPARFLDDAARHRRRRASTTGPRAADDIEAKVRAGLVDTATRHETSCSWSTSDLAKRHRSLSKAVLPRTLTRKRPTPSPRPLTATTHGAVDRHRRIARPATSASRPQPEHLRVQRRRRKPSSKNPTGAALTRTSSRPRSAARRASSIPVYLRIGVRKASTS